ncbi:MAG: hypothetical protein JJD92_13715 [Frankiaceae bacterium]|nr:hypothetical protein [Frankiaceae bacterium]
MVVIDVNRRPILADRADTTLGLDQYVHLLLREAVLAQRVRLTLSSVVALFAVAVAAAGLPGRQRERFKGLDVSTACAALHAGWYWNPFPHHVPLGSAASAAARSVASLEAGLAVEGETVRP